LQIKPVRCRVRPKLSSYRAWRPHRRQNSFRGAGILGGIGRQDHLIAGGAPGPTAAEQFQRRAALERNRFVVGRCTQGSKAVDGAGRNSRRKNLTRACARAQRPGPRLSRRGRQATAGPSIQPAEAASASERLAPAPQVAGQHWLIPTQGRGTLRAWGRQLAGCAAIETWEFVNCARSEGFSQARQNSVATSRCASCQA